MRFFRFNWLWGIVIFLSFSISLVNILGINFNLINVEGLKFSFFDFSKSIVDESMNINVTADIIVKNIIGSNFSIEYSKTTQVLSTDLVCCTDFTKKKGIANTAKSNYHNVILRDEGNNKFFLKDYPYNKIIWYADCNDELTNCAIYSSYILENNNHIQPCYEINLLGWNGTKYVQNIRPLERYYKNPSECLDYNNISVD